MKSHRLSVLVSLAVAACMTVATTASRVSGYVVQAMRATRDAFFGFALHVVDLVAGERIDFKPQVLRVQARAFVLRLMRRDRPVIAPNWRMCPSA